MRQHPELLGWPDRSHAQQMADKHDGVLIGSPLGNENNWLMADEIDALHIEVAAWGVTSKDGEQMLDEDEQWVFVA
jgi:hypothetical protein